MLAQSCFHRSGRLDNVLDGLFGSLGRLLLDITNLGMNGIERRASVNAAALDLGNDLCRDEFVAHCLGVAFLIDRAENLRQRARLDFECLAAEQVVGNQLGALGRKRRLAAQTLSEDAFASPVLARKKTESASLRTRSFRVIWMERLVHQAD